MSYRKSSVTLPKVIRDGDQRTRRMESGASKGSKWQRSCNSFGCISLVSPSSDFDLGGDTLQVTYEITPIWPGETGYPGIKITRTQLDKDTGATTVSSVNIAV